MKKLRLVELIAFISLVSVGCTSLGGPPREPASETVQAKSATASCEILSSLNSKHASTAPVSGWISAYSVVDPVSAQTFFTVEPEACSRAGYPIGPGIGYVDPAELLRGCTVVDKDIPIGQVPSASSQTVYEFKMGDFYFNSTAREKCLDLGIPLVGILGYTR